MHDDLANSDMTAPDLARWAQHAAPGDRLVYHAGDLASDRAVDRRVNAVARSAASFAAEGSFTLFQRRVPDGGYLYLIVKRRPAR